MRVGDAWGGETFITSALLGLGNASKSHFPYVKAEVIKAHLADAFYHNFLECYGEMTNFSFIKPGQNARRP